MKTDSEIKKDIADELNWNPNLENENISVELNNGHVTLSGSISSYPKKIDAEEAARRIMGVKSVSNELKVNIPARSKRTDAEIKKAVLDSIKWNSSIDETKLKVDVKDGWVSLQGEVGWQYQRSKARLLAEDVTGVTGVTNHVTVAPTSAISSDVENEIAAALKRNSYLNSNKINVEVRDGKAILRGTVKNLLEKRAAETAAWSARSITEVVNEIVVDYSEVFA